MTGGFNDIWHIAQKELRGFFNSGVALIFLAAFLAAVLFTFFWVDQFFVRGIADVRPLFNWLPVLLIFLVAALTMRLWSEEQKLGTLEVLLTLPVPIHSLVLGKFLAGLLLVGLALALTLGLPLTVSMMGPLDWGPVIGGYLAALLLAGAYLAIGLCISSTTDNQIIALIFTTVCCALLHILGIEAVTGLVGNVGAELLRDLGMGSRFESIQRGVVDLRDIAYYASFVTFFLVLNTAMLHAKRWSSGARGRKQRFNVRLLVNLTLANLVALNVWLAPVQQARVDLTERKVHSISKVTSALLDGLQDPLLIRGYFSERTHPLLAPLVPQVSDLLAEYDAAGGAQVKVEIVDPRSDEELEKEAQQEYGIKSVPFQVADRHESALVNSYFHILIKYGDQYETLGFDDLIEVKVSGIRNVEVKLRNLEYDVTRAIKKVVYGFQSVDGLFASMTEPAKLTLFTTPETLPEDLKEAPGRIAKIAQELTDIAGGKFSFSQVVPEGEAQMQELAKTFGIRPIAVSLFSEDFFYLHMVLEVGDKKERVVPEGEMTEADIRKALEAGLKRSAPGFLKTVGIVKPPAPAAPPQQFGMPQPPPQGEQFRLLEETLGANYRVEQVKLDKGLVPGDIDVLLVAGAEKLSQTAAYAIDQFAMRGGATILLASPYKLDMSAMQELKVRKVDTGLNELLKAYGIEMQDKLLLDEQNQALPVPVAQDLGGFVVRRIELLPYPYFVDIRGEGMAEGHPLLQGLPGLTMQWASPLKATKVEGQPEAQTLLSSSASSWTDTGTEVQPDFKRFVDSGFPSFKSASDDNKGPHALAMVLQGQLTSAWKGKQAPDGKDEAPEDDGHGHGEPPPEKVELDPRALEVIESSPPDTRLVVVSSASLVSDEVLSLARQTGSDAFLSNLRFMENLVDWALADVDLLTIRSRGSYTRPLLIEEGAAQRWELINYGFAFAALLVVLTWGLGRRRRLTPMTLVGDDGQGRKGDVA